MFNNAQRMVLDLGPRFGRSRWPHVQLCTDGESSAQYAGPGSRSQAVAHVGRPLHDRILFGKYAGQEIKLDGADYLVREEEVLVVIEDREQQKKS